MMVWPATSKCSDEPRLIAVIALPSIVRMGSRGGEERGILMPSMTIADADGAKLMNFPETVMAEAPGISVWPPITYSEAVLAVMGLPSIVRTGNNEGEWREVAVPSMTIADAEGAKPTVVPETARAGAPGTSV